MYLILVNHRNVFPPLSHRIPSLLIHVEDVDWIMTCGKRVWLLKSAVSSSGFGPQSWSHNRAPWLWCVPEQDTGSQAANTGLWFRGYGFLWWPFRHRKCVVCASVLYLHWGPKCEITLISSLADWILYLQSYGYVKKLTSIL